MTYNTFLTIVHRYSPSSQLLFPWSILQQLFAKKDPTPPDNTIHFDNPLMVDCVSSVSSALRCACFTPTTIASPSETIFPMVNLLINVLASRKSYIKKLNFAKTEVSNVLTFSKTSF